MMMNSRIALMVIGIIFLAGWVHAGDFKIQRGVTVIATGQTNNTINAGVDYTAPADINKAFIRITGSKLGGLGHGSGGGTQTPADFQAYVGNPKNLLTSITFTRPNANISLNTRVEWEIIEYTGPDNGPNRMIVRNQNALVAQSGTQISGSAITNVTNHEDVVVFITGQAGDSTSSTGLDRGLYYSEWGGAANPTPIFTKGDGAATGDVSFAIVEFSGKNWQVQRVSHTYSAGGSNQNEILERPIVDVNKAFLHVQLLTNSGTNDETGHRAWISDVNTVTFRVASGASVPTQTMTGVAWIIENTQTDGNQMNVQTWFGNNPSGGSEPETFTQTINQVKDVNQTSIWGEGADASGTGSTPPRMTHGMYLTDSTTVTLWTSDSGNGSDYVFEVVEWPSAPSVTASTATTTFTFYINTVTTTSHSITFGGSCVADGFFFVESNALLDPDTDGNAAQVKPAAYRNNGYEYYDKNYVGVTSPSGTHTAYSSATASFPPTSPTQIPNEFSSGNYTNVSGDEGAIFTETSGDSTKYPTLRFRFIAGTAAENVADINFFFVGEARENNNCATLLTTLQTQKDLNIFGYNYDTNQYDQIFTRAGTGTTDANDLSVEVHIDMSASKYVASDQNINILVQGDHPTTDLSTSCIHVDFVSLEITQLAAAPSFCQSDTIAPITITNTGSGSTNIDANFASAFTGSDLNIILKTWMGTGSGCGTDGVGGWETNCSISSTTAPVTQTQCKQFDQSNATTGSRLVSGLGAGDTNQLCFSGDFDGFVSAGDHNQTFQTGNN